MKRKCALIVDDSNTARTVLAKKLMAYEIDVETRDSAASAIDYLYENTPDAVFMDYEMPGMDGFQALKIIKSNPNTATIPVMMYTSRAGGLELSQARAFGAVGVLPKELERQDLDAVIEELHLLPNQESLGESFQDQAEIYHPPRLRSVEATGSNIEYLNGLQPPDDPPQIEYPAENYDESVFLLKRQTRLYQKELANAEQRMQGYINREFTQLRDEVLEHRQPGLSGKGFAGRFVIFINLLLLCLLGVLLWQQSRDTLKVQGVTRMQRVESGLEIVREQIEGLRDTLAMPQPVKAVSSPSSLNESPSRVKVNTGVLEWAANRGTGFLYGENPYSDERIAWLSEMVNQISSTGFKGIIQLRANYGNFCLSRSETGSLLLAPPQMAFADCLFAKDLDEEKTVQGSYQTIGFANFLNSLLTEENPSVEVIIEADDHGEPIVPYPDPYRVKSVGEWNRLASQNQRILVSLIQQPD